MSDLWWRLLGVKSLDPRDPQVEFAFAHPMAAWVWVCLGLVVAFVAGWGYWRLVGRRWPRVTLGVIRAMVLGLVLVLIAGPQLEKRIERVEKDWVVVLADRSASMQIQDSLNTDGSLESRDAELRRALALAGPMIEQLKQTREVAIFGFDSGVRELPSRVEQGALAIDLGEANGSKTSLGRTLDQVSSRMASRPLAGVILLTDGRSTDSFGRGSTRSFEARRVPIYPVEIGGKETLTDDAITRVDAPTAAFVQDLVPVSVEIQRHAQSEAGTSGPRAGARVELIDTTTGDVLDSADVSAGDLESGRHRLTLTAKPGGTGRASWSVRIVSGSRDLSESNNTRDVRLELIDRPIRVLVIDGTPRWEYRYLKNLVLRESSIRSTCMILASGKRFIQEGTDPIEFIPRSPEDWAPFDTVVLGNFRPGQMSEEQLESLKMYVAERGGGLMFIGGEGAMPDAWRETALADLMPFVLGDGPGGLGSLSTWTSGVVMDPAPAAERLGVLHLGDTAGEGWPGFLNDGSSSWAVLRWAQRIETSQLKPTAETLAYAHPPDSINGERVPLVATMRYGAGRVVYVGTDEIWRLRYARGEALPERFYLPLIRMLAREGLGRAGKPAIMELSAEQVVSDEPVRVLVRVLDQALLSRRPSSIPVRAVKKGTDEPAGDVELMPEGAGSTEAPTSVYSGRLVLTEPGEYEIVTRDPALAAAGVAAELLVVAPDDEMRVPQTDHQTLETIAKATGGKVIKPTDIASIAPMLPNREVRTLGLSEVETLWDKPGIWTIMLLLLVVEWIGRRLVRLA